MPKAWARELWIFPIQINEGFICVSRVSEPQPFDKFKCSVYSEYRIAIYTEAVQVIDHVGETVESNITFFRECYTFWRKGTDCRQDIISSASLLNSFLLLEQVEVSFFNNSFLLSINLRPDIASLY